MHATCRTNAIRLDRCHAEGRRSAPLPLHSAGELFLCGLCLWAPRNYETDCSRIFTDFILLQASERALTFGVFPLPYGECFFFFLHIRHYSTARGPRVIGQARVQEPLTEPPCKLTPGGTGIPDRGGDARTYFFLPETISRLSRPKDTTHLTTVPRKRIANHTKISRI